MDYRPKYHASVRSGWGNDPNGMIYYNGKAHLFFQHYPHAPEWGIMHWGHFTTEDFVHWKEEPIALYPDQEYEQDLGCWSGTSIEIDGRLYLAYTCSRPGMQRQCFAWSEDGGMTFQKFEENPVVTAEQMNGGFSAGDFRDPKVFRHEDSYYMIAGTRLFRKGMHTCGNLVLMRSQDLKAWSFVGVMLHQQDGFPSEYFNLDGCYECPDRILSNGKEILLSSPQCLPQMGNRYQNKHCVVYISGQTDFETGRFHIDEYQDLDSGFDLYAPQTMTLPDGRIIMIAWKEMWARTHYTKEQGFVGTYTLPRELEYRDGRLYQYPVREIEQFRGAKTQLEQIRLHDGGFEISGFEGNVYELNLTMKREDAARMGVRILKGPDHETCIYLDALERTVVFDRTKGGREIRGEEADNCVRKCDIERIDTVDLRIFVDVTSVEVFVDGGRYTFTGNVYPEEGDRGIEFFAQGGSCIIEKAVRYELDV